ncbi:penicillin-binding protein [Fusobacterium pseudoperiodonticum]|uniref:penicillin-binding protein n=1 Tax=Fusobacterium pseudoperiodonticum TaxID=2663009 RepID=UPI0030CFFB80
MKTINFYKKEKLIFSVYAESLEDVLKSPLSYFQGYTNDMIITDITYQYPFFKDDVLREMSKEEKVRANIPVQLDDGEFIKDKKLITVPKPVGNQKYMYWDKEKSLWMLDNQKEYDDYCTLIDNLKAEALAYGFDYKVENKEHRQKCRDTDISKMVSVIVSLQLAKSMGVEKKVTWYFEDNVGMSAGLQELGQLMLYGTTFVQSVYDTENYFKTKVNPKDLSKAEFEAKRKEIHTKLAIS